MNGHKCEHTYFNVRGFTYGFCRDQRVLTYDRYFVASEFFFFFGCTKSIISSAEKRYQGYQHWDVWNCYKLWVNEPITNLLPEPLAVWVILLRVHLSEPGQISITEVPRPASTQGSHRVAETRTQTVNHRSDYCICAVFATNFVLNPKNEYFAWGHLQKPQQLEFNIWARMYINDNQNHNEVSLVSTLDLTWDSLPLGESEILRKT